MKQLQVMATTQFQRLLSPSLSTPPPSSPVSTSSSSEPVEEERELELLQMDRLLPWMAMVFDGSESSEETRRAHKQELFSLYRSLCSEYQQWKHWKAYNQSLWLLSSYRRRDTKGLARKLLSDVRLFKEGLQLLWLLEHKTETPLRP